MFACCLFSAQKCPEMSISIIIIMDKETRLQGP